MESHACREIKAMLAASDAPGALERCERHVRTQPRDPDGYFLRALVRSVQGRPWRASRDYKRGLRQLGPDAQNVHFHQAFRTELALAPESSPRAAALSNLAVALFRRGAVKAAGKSLDEALQLEPAQRFIQENWLAVSIARGLARIFKIVAILFYFAALLLTPLLNLVPDEDGPTLLMSLAPLTWLFYSLCVQGARALARERLRLIGWDVQLREGEPGTGAIHIQGHVNKGKVMRAMFLIFMACTVGLLFWRLRVIGIRTSILCLIGVIAAIHFLWSALRAPRIHLVLRPEGLEASGQLIAWNSLRQLREKTTLGQMGKSLIRRIRILEIEAEQASLRLSDEDLTPLDYETLVFTLEGVLPIERSTHTDSA